jgi:hypothetical protein
MHRTMWLRRLVAGLAIGVIMGVSGPAALAQAPTGGQADAPDSKFGIGFQSSWPAYGLSGIYDVNETLTAQAVLGAFGNMSTLSGRGLYHFQRAEKHSLYGFGTLGLWRHSYNFLGVSESESSVGLGGGGGIELDWRRIIDADEPEPTFPRLYSSIDLGFVLASFDHYDFSGLVIGAGMHYRF